LELVQTAETTPMPVERQGALITLEITIDQREDISEGHLIKMGITEILIKIEFAKTKELDYKKISKQIIRNKRRQSNAN